VTETCTKSKGGIKIKRVKLDTKTVALVVTFSALTIVLNLSPAKIPAPYAPYLVYQIWEIPIVAAFLLYGFAAGTLIAVINTLVLLAVFPGMLITGPLYNFVAAMSMLLGLVIPKIAKKNPQKYTEKSAVALFTMFGIIFRVGIMTLVNWTFLRFPPPVGFGLPEEAVVASLPFIAFFNATLAFYTIPLGYLIAKAIKTRVKG
jgi:riboflavin transporter FmnP